MCMLFSLFFLGTWPAVMTLLERRGRLPQHTYLDYTMTNLLAAIIIALTFGELGSERPNFIYQLTQLKVSFLGIWWWLPYYQFVLFLREDNWHFNVSRCLRKTKDIH